MIKLIGILLVAVGFLFRLNTLLVVMVAGIVTGMVSGLSFYDVISMFGKFFIENRYMSMPIILTLPVIGILERYGLKERAEALITKSKGATTGRVINVIFYDKRIVSSTWTEYWWSCTNGKTTRCADGRRGCAR